MGPNLTLKETAEEAMPDLDEALRLLSSESVRRYLLRQMMAIGPTQLGIEHIEKVLIMMMRDAGHDPKNFKSRQFSTADLNRI